MFSFNRRQRDIGHREQRAAVELTEKHHALAQQIASLENFICEAPARAAERQLDRMQTIPPPEEFDGGPATTLLEPDEPPRLSRAQLAQARATRRRNMIVFFCALAAFAIFAHWLANAIS